MFEFWKDMESSESIQLGILWNFFLKRTIGSWAKLTILLGQMGWLVCDHDVQDLQNCGAGSGLGVGHYQNKRPCKAEPSAALVLVRTSPRALHHVITGASFFSFGTFGVSRKKESRAFRRECIGFAKWPAYNACFIAGNKWDVCCITPLSE
jgi:hypothetical protein